MKTFHLVIPETIRLNKKQPFAKAILCFQTWEVFNDDGIRQVLIFKLNGDLLVSTDGEMSTGSWMYHSANQSLIVSALDKSNMFHPIYWDGVLLALQQDGRQNTLFLVAEKKRDSFPYRTVKDLELYFVSKEHEPSAKENRTLAREEKKEIRRLEKEKEENARVIAKEIWNNKLKGTGAYFATLFLTMLIFAIPFLFLLWFFYELEWDIDWETIVWSLLLFIPLMICSYFIAKSAQHNSIEYFTDRQVQLDKLSLQPYKAVYYRANTWKFIPVMFRVIGWLFAIIVAISYIFAAVEYGVLEDLPWWGWVGVSWGLGLACYFWVWLGKFIARKIEKKLSLRA